MPTTFAPHVIHRKRKLAQKGAKPTLIDNLIWPVAIAGPAFTIPQILLIWQKHDAQGISTLTWAGYSTLAFIWFVYGILHKEKALTFSSGLNLTMNVLVLIGALLYGH